MQEPIGRQVSRENRKLEETKKKKLINSSFKGVFEDERLLTVSNTFKNTNLKCFGSDWVLDFQDGSVGTKDKCGYNRKIRCQILMN